MCILTARMYVEIALDQMAQVERPRTPLEACMVVALTAAGQAIDGTIEEGRAAQVVDQAISKAGY